MTDTRKRWFKEGIVFGTVPDDVPSEKTEKFLNFLNFFENVIFSIFDLFFIKNILLWDTFEKVKNWCFNKC